MAFDLDDPRPTYLQLADALAADVASGRYAVGDRLPSVRSIVREFDVAMATAQRALSVLQDGGVVVSRPGHGTVVRKVPDAPSDAATDTAHASLRAQVEDLQRRVAALEAREAER